MASLTRLSRALLLIQQLVKYHHFQYHHHHCHHCHLHNHYHHHHHHIHHPKPDQGIIQEHVSKFGNKPSYGSCGRWTILLHGSMSSNCVLLSLPGCGSASLNLCIRKAASPWSQRPSTTLDLEVWWFWFYEMVLHCTSPAAQKSTFIFITRFSSVPASVEWFSVSRMRDFF